MFGIYSHKFYGETSEKEFVSLRCAQCFSLHGFFSTYPLTDGLIMSHGLYTHTKCLHEISAIPKK